MSTERVKALNAAIREALQASLLEHGFTYEFTATGSENVRQLVSLRDLLLTRGIQWLDANSDVTALQGAHENATRLRSIRHADFRFGHVPQPVHSRIPRCHAECCPALAKFSGAP